MPSDAELIRQILAGKTDLYAILVKRYERLARATALKTLRDRHIADDVSQEAFVAAFKGLASLRNRSNFGAWLLGIVRRRSVTAFRKAQHDSRTSENLDQLASTKETSLSPISIELLELIDQLPEQERIVIGLRHFEGNSVQEIAEITERPVGTVTKQLSRARQRLKGWLTEEDLPHERIYES